MDSINHSLPSHLVCPVVRTNLKIQCRMIYGVDCFIVNNSYYISNAKDGESSYSHHLLPLIGCNNRETVATMQFSVREEESCGGCRSNTIGTTYYFCTECDKWYHRECVESPSMFKSPYHPKHPLQLYIHVSGFFTVLDCECQITRDGFLFYHCSICDFSLDPVCAKKPPYINHQKKHEHTLYYFPRQFNITCDVCGGNYKTLMFVCIQCDFFVHKWCIYLPQVMKISRHKHRLYFVSSLSCGERSCGVCRKEIDENYRAYTCMTKSCIYVVHTGCATMFHTSRMMWDGKELEGEPEEDDESIKPSFEEISDGIILHFSHPEHPMRVDDVKIRYDEEKYCQACILPLYNDAKAYRCTKCDYDLHEECAYLPRVISHAVHAHSLNLEPCFTHIKLCHCCKGESCGFKYVCYNIDCNNFSLDVRCASISEPYDYRSHRHPLFFNLFSGTCSSCNETTDTLTCEECLFFLCFGCATLPYMVRYKNDEYILSFSYLEVKYEDYWCDLCEEAIIPTRYSRIYWFNECEIALHIECLLGKELYMNPGSRVTIKGEDFNIVLNRALTRPICRGCQIRCKYRMMFTASSGDIYCSIEHINDYYLLPVELEIKAMIQPNDKQKLEEEDVN